MADTVTSGATPSDDWRRAALLVVVAATLLRLVLLAFNRTDLFVDESQYWLWGQDFAFGYYSKPPLIAWVIGLSTWIGGDTPYFVRAPFALFHGATALILAALGNRLAGPRVALLVAATYVTLPMVAVGSLLASTDTIMAPFFAAALYFHTRLAVTRHAWLAVAAGVCLGFAFLAKYAALYFLIGVVGGAALIPALRIGWRNGALLLLAFAAVAAPNLIWNAAHGFSTVAHTADNISWVRNESPLGALSPASAAQFVLAQFGVAGPMVFAAVVAGFLRRDTARLTVFALPSLLIVTAQALLDKAYANWAASAYFAGTIAAVMVLARYPRLVWTSLAINGAVALILPLLTLVPAITVAGSDPLLDRWTGQAAMSRQIIDTAVARGGLPVVAQRRDVLADLFFTGVKSSLNFYAVPPDGRPMNHYEQTHALPADLTGPVLFIATTPPACAHERLALDPGTGAYARAGLQAFVVDAGCARAR